MTTPFPAPQPDEVDAPFWSAFAHGRLVLQRCDDCGRFGHPPTMRCIHCGSMRRGWAGVPDEGVLYSFTVARTAAQASAAGRVPYAVLLVAFPACDGVRLLGNAPSIPIEALRIGMRLRWRIVAPATLEFFTPA